MWEWIGILGMPELGLVLIPALLLVYLAGVKEVKPYLKLYTPSILIFLIIAFTIKSFFPLPRPCIPCPAEGCNPYCPADGSFPSGHAGTAWIIWLPPLLIKREKKFLWFPGIPILVSFSRIMLGVHRWIDVFGGGILALFIIFVIFYIQKERQRPYRKL